MARKKKRKIKKDRVAFLVVFLLIIALMVVALTAQIFNINSITVSPCENLAYETILLSASIPEGENIFRTNLKKSKNKISQIPYVDNVDILRKFPDKVVINIRESVIVAYIPYGENMIGIDKKGKVVEITTEIHDKIILTNLTVVNAEPGKKIEFEKQNDDMFFLCLDKFEEWNLTHLIASADLSNRTNISFITKDGLKVILGSTEEIDYKIKLLINIREKGYNTGIFDVNDPSVPTYRSVE